MASFDITKILVPLDFSRTSLKALDYAIQISKITSSEIILMHVSEGLYQNLEPGYFTQPVVMVDYQKTFIDQSDKHLYSLAEKIKKKKIDKISKITVIGSVQGEILNFAKKEKVDLIVMGTHGVSGFREFFIGSNTFRIIRDSVCPVLSIQKKNPSPSFNNILIPFRDKPHSREKVNYAIYLAQKFSSTIFVLGIDDESTVTHRNKIRLETEQIKNISIKHGVKCNVKIISNAYVGDVVLKYAQSKNIDLIISMADLDKMDIKEYFTGPYAQQIVNHSPIPVLSIRPKFNPDTIDLRFY